jgi:hypothetical protein
MAKNFLTVSKNSLSWGANLERKKMKPETYQINPKRCSWWWRANPMG